MVLYYIRMKRFLANRNETIGGGGSTNAAAKPKEAAPGKKLEKTTQPTL